MRPSDSHTEVEIIINNKRKNICLAVNTVPSDARKKVSDDHT